LKTKAEESCYRQRQKKAVEDKGRRKLLKTKAEVSCYRQRQKKAVEDKGRRKQTKDKGRCSWRETTPFDATVPPQEEQRVHGLRGR
jgi:hypothetical protein